MIQIGSEVKYSFYPDEDQTQPLEIVDAIVDNVHENETTVDLTYEIGDGEEVKTVSVNGVNPSEDPAGNTYQIPVDPSITSDENEDIAGTPEPGVE